MTEHSKPEKLSTSALARQLELPLQSLFSCLRESGWIKKLEDGWALTAKGEFEGGEYRHSKRFGRYIVWPPTIAEHAILKAMDDTRMLSAAELASPWQLSPATMHRALAELGWLKRSFHGWELTALGQQQGGVQLESKQSGMLYVSWPESVNESAALQRLLQSCRDIAQPAGDDLFSKSSGKSLDGHQFDSQGCLQICHWLYLAGVMHACQRALPVKQTLYADFYLPRQGVYLEYWDKDEDSSALSARLERMSLYKELSLPLIELHPDDLPHLDEIMPRQLRRYGVEYL